MALRFARALFAVLACSVAAMIGGADCTADCDAAGELSSLKGWVAVGRGCSECTAGMASSAAVLTFTWLEEKSGDGCLAIGAAIRVEDTLWFVTGGGAKTAGALAGGEYLISGVSVPTPTMTETAAMRLPRASKPFQAIRST